MEIRNLLDVPRTGVLEEQFDTLAESGSVRIERILSQGHVTPSGTWYDQDRDEWVALLQGEASIEFEDGRVVTMTKGDHVLIPAHDRHRVTTTSTEPPCIWLAVHGDLLTAGSDQLTGQS